MERFDFPYHKQSVEYPQSGFRLELGRSYAYTANEPAPDQRIFRLYFDAMRFYGANYYSQRGEPSYPQLGDVWLDAGSKNLFAWSENLVEWEDQLGATVVTATKITETASNIIHFAERYAPYIDGTGAYVFTAKVSPAERSGIILELRSFTNEYQAWFDLDTGAITNISTGATAEIINLGGNDFLCVLKVENLNTVTTPAQRVYVWKTDSPTAAYLGEVNKGITIKYMQLEKGTVPGRYIKTTGAVLSTIGSNKSYRYDGATWVLTANPSRLNILLQPEINAGRLDDFYVRHKLSKKFIYDHPLYGDVAVRFNKPLILPKGYSDGGGVIEPFELEFLEVPGGL